MFEYLANNKEWIFSGIGVFLITFIIHTIKKNKGKDISTNNASQTNNVNQTITVNIPNEQTLKNKSIYLSKNCISILFIDDEIFDYIKILKQAGYTNVKRIPNIKSLDCNEIYNADIIFVDINGVGANLFPKEQGLGVAKAIKIHYKEKKKVYLYSAQNQQLNSDFNQLDGVLAKNADPYEFINIIDNFFEYHNN